VTDFDDIAEENVWDAGNEWTEGAQENKEDTDTQDDWENEEGDEDGDVCEDCGMRLPSFAMMAHRRFHVAA
jgi:L-ribulose-5-phosphate 3-epimerase UlaE